MMTQSRASNKAFGMDGKGCSRHETIGGAAAALLDGCPGSQQRPASMTGSTIDRPGLARLILHPDPGVRQLRLEVPRDRARIPSVLAAALRDCSEGRSPWPLFAHGPAGVGKTCAGLYLCDRVARGSVVFTDFAGMCGRMADAKNGRDTLTAEQLWRRWAGNGLCVLDEIGLRDTVSDHVYEVAQRAIDLRAGKPLLVLSNLDLNALARVFDDRVASRLASGTVVHVDGPDQRLR